MVERRRTIDDRTDGLWTLMRITSHLSQGPPQNTYERARSKERRSVRVFVKSINLPGAQSWIELAAGAGTRRGWRGHNTNITGISGSAWESLIKVCGLAPELYG